jgi:hypothetical protein
MATVTPLVLLVWYKSTPKVFGVELGKSYATGQVLALDGANKKAEM